MRHGYILRALTSGSTLSRRFLSTDSKEAVALTLTPREKEEELPFAEYIKQFEAKRSAEGAKQNPVEKPVEKPAEASRVTFKKT